jgi:hypothetical protein
MSGRAELLTLRAAPEQFFPHQNVIEVPIIRLREQLGEKSRITNLNSPNKALSKVVEGYFAGVTGEKIWQRSDGAILWLRSKLNCPLGASRSPRIRSQAQSGKGTKSETVGSAILANVKC